MCAGFNNIDPEVDTERQIRYKIRLCLGHGFNNIDPEVDTESVPGRSARNPRGGFNNIDPEVDTESSSHR